MYRNMKMVPRQLFGRGSLDQLEGILAERRTLTTPSMIFLVDEVFQDRELARRLPMKECDRVIWINVDDEPTTYGVDRVTNLIRESHGSETAGVIGIGGGSVLDTAKAVSVMLTNPGSSADYQGYDLARNRSLYHVGVPTLSGTGAEVSRTAVLTGPEKKLGINSDHSVFDQIVLDPDLLRGVPEDQRFYTGMDCYIHCVESLEGTFLNAFSRSCGEEAMKLCKEVFLEPGDPESDEKLMVASMWGGLSIAYSQVGVCHAMSYGLSYVLKLHHGIGNCTVFDYLEEFYPEGVEEFHRMRDMYGISLPRNLTAGLTDERMDTMLNVALSLEPLWENALGPDWKRTMTRQRAEELFRRM